MTAETRLITYGSLRPGEANHHVMAGIPGRWVRGKVQGTIDPRGRYPKYHAVANGKWIDVMVFISAVLRRHWTRIDRFEASEGYRRVIVPVRIKGVPAAGYIYRAARP